jgi:hypothetical protein
LSCGAAETDTAAEVARDCIDAAPGWMWYAMAAGAVLSRPCGRARCRARFAGGSAGVLLGEVGLVVGAAKPEPQRVVCRAFFKVDRDPLYHSGLGDCVGYLHRTRSTAIQ